MQQLRRKRKVISAEKEANEINQEEEQPSEANLKASLTHVNS